MGFLSRETRNESIIGDLTLPKDLRGQIRQKVPVDHELQRRVAIVNLRRDEQRAVARIRERSGMLGVRVPERAVLKATRLEPQQALFLFFLPNSTPTGVDLPLFPCRELIQGLRAVWDQFVGFSELRRRVASHPRQDPALFHQRVEDFFIPPAQVDAPLELGKSELVVAHLVVRTRQVKGHARIIWSFQFLGLEDPNIKVTPALFGFRVEDLPVHKLHPEILAGHDDVLSRMVVP